MVKKSDFVQTTTIPDSATLDFVDSLTNKKITFADFKAQLGVTGAMTAVGDPSGVAPFTVDGTTYKFKKFESGVGISVTQSPLQGVKISHNIVAGSGITLAESNGQLTISVT